MQMQWENDLDFEKEMKVDPFKLLKKMKLKMCDPLKVKCHFVTLIKKLEQSLMTKQEDEESLFDL